MFTITVTIGRNDGPATRTAGVAVPMSAQDWQAFQDEVRELFSVLYGTGLGTGEWEGISEDTFLAVGQVADLAAVRSRLAELCVSRRQDAIGLVAQAGDDTQVSAFSL